MSYILYLSNYYITFFKLGKVHEEKGDIETAMPVVNISGQIERRSRNNVYLGNMINGHPQSIDIRLLTAEDIKVKLSNNVSSYINTQIEQPVRSDGNLINITLKVIPRKVTDSAMSFTIKLHTEQNSEEICTLYFHIDSIRRITEINHVQINRLKGGAHFAFLWRIDCDHPVNRENLQSFLDLVMKWKIPPSMFISGMVLDENLYGKFTSRECKYVLHDLRDRIFGYTQLPSISEMQTVKRILSGKKYEKFSEFPITEFSAEIGNHMYHHFGGPEANWEEPPADVSVLEKEIIELDRLIEISFGIKPQVWARPAGKRYPAEFLQVLLNNKYLGTSGYRHWTRPWTNPCLRVKDLGGIYEIGSNFPRDPYFKLDILMWERTIDYCNLQKPECGLHLVLGSHLGPPFLIQTRSNLEHLFKKVLESSAWICTFSCLIRYLEQIQKLRIDWGKNYVRIQNTDDENVYSVPLDITFDGGYRYLLIVDCPGKSERKINFGFNQTRGM